MIIMYQNFTVSEIIKNWSSRPTKVSRLINTNLIEKIWFVKIIYYICIIKPKKYTEFLYLINFLFKYKPFLHPHSP